jgi:hypothetical protein
MGLARLSLYMFGIAAGVTAIIVYRNRPADLKTSPNRRLPVHQAANMLRNAWADHHTTA